MKQLVLASNNAGKIREFCQLFQNMNITLVPQKEFQAPDIEETGLSFIENAILKARNAARYSKKPALADDSGLVVDYLQGEPGIYSARYSKEQTDNTNNSLLIEKLNGVPNNLRQAHFKCVLALVRYENDPVPLIAEGEVYGEILTTPQGTQGFGYDPLFWLESYQKTMAEISMEEKNRISHRAKALEQLVLKIKDHAIFN